MEAKMDESRWTCDWHGGRSDRTRESKTVFTLSLSVPSLPFSMHDEKKRVEEEEEVGSFCDLSRGDERPSH